MSRAAKTPASAPKPRRAKKEAPKKSVPKKSAAQSAKRARRPSSDAILEAAEKIFARQGFADTSLRQLMAAAQVSTTAFYARFDSRDAVLEELAMRFLAELGAEAAEKLATARNIEEGFDIGVEVLLGAVKGKRDLVRLLLGEANASVAVRQSLARAYGQLASLLAGNLQRLVDRGELEPADATTVGWALVGAVKIQLERWALLDELDDDGLAQALSRAAQAMLPVLRRRSA